MSTVPVIEQVPSAEPDFFYVSVSRYHEMIDAGIFGDGDHVELIAGRIINKMPSGSHHFTLVMTLYALLTRLLPEGWHVRPQGAITTDDSEPEPDIAIVRGTMSDYYDRHPTPAETAFVIEVADSSLHRDRTTKVALYAANNIPVYWIFNVQQNEIEVYAQPDGNRYRYMQTFSAEDTLPIMIDGTEIGRITVKEITP